MDPTIWGPWGWSYLHSSALHADEANTRHFFATFLENFVQTLPCDACRGHAQVYLKTKPQNISEGAFEQTFHFHNAVNERLKKPTMAYEEAFLKQSIACTKSCKEKISTQECLQKCSSPGLSMFLVIVILLAISIAVQYRKPIQEWTLQKFAALSKKKNLGIPSEPALLEPLLSADLKNP